MQIAYVICKDRRTAKKRCPWAVKIIRFRDGWKAFEWIENYKDWIRQGYPR